MECHLIGLRFFAVGQTLLSVNGVPVTGGQMENGKDALEFLDDVVNFPVKYVGSLFCLLNLNYFSLT